MSRSLSGTRRLQLSTLRDSGGSFGPLSGSTISRICSFPRCPPPSSGEVAELMANLPVFVRQLTSIGASETLIATAVGDFLRSTSDKVTWAAEGEIVEDSLEELDEALLRHHLLGRDEVEDIHGHLSPEEQGRYLYRKCLALTLPLEGRTLPTYFIPGEFNCLADLCRLGWHPDYESLFSDKA